MARAASSRSVRPWWVWWIELVRTSVVPISRSCAFWIPPTRVVAGRRREPGNRPGRGGVHRFDRQKDPTLDTGTDDADVLARVRAGDRDAYAELVQRHAPV